MIWFDRKNCRKFANGSVRKQATRGHKTLAQRSVTLSQKRQRYTALLLVPKQQLSPSQITSGSSSETVTSIQTEVGYPRFVISCRILKVYD